MALRFVSVMGCASIAVACGGDRQLQLPPVRASTARIEYRSDASLDACPDAAERVQGRVETFERLFGVNAPEHIVYVRYEDAAGLQRDIGCTPEATGCELDATVASTSFVDLHELVHVSLEQQGAPDSLVREGVAVAYEHLGRSLWRDLDNAVIWPAWTDAVTQAQAYPPPSVAHVYGGAFSAFLISTQNFPNFLQFYRTSTNAASPATFAAQFQSAYGTSLEDTWAAAGARVTAGNAARRAFDDSPASA